MKWADRAKTIIESKDAIVILLDDDTLSEQTKDAMRKIRARYPDLLMILASTEPKKFERYKQLFDSVIQKPFSVSDLFEVIVKSSYA